MAEPRLRRWYRDRNYFDANDAIVILSRYFGSLNGLFVCMLRLASHKLRLELRRVARGSNDKLTARLRSSAAAESACGRAAKLGDYLSAGWLMKVYHSLATYHRVAADMNKRCAMWLPSFLQRGIHFFGERTEVLAFNNFVLFDRVHLPMIGKRAAVVEEDLLSVREPVRARTGTLVGEDSKLLA